MNSNDSYPPEDINDSKIEKEDLKKDVESVQNEELEKKQDGWDGSEAEIVVDDESEEYEEETTGIKLTYKLTAQEIKDFVRRSDVYAKNKKAQHKHILMQSLVIIAMIIFGFLSQKYYYLLFTICPITAIILIWIMPLFGINKFIKDVFKNEEISVEIFPDKIDVNGKNFSKEIILDGSCECKEHDNLITVSAKDGISLIIPVRAVEPEFLAEVQAMILAGTKTET